MSTLHDPQYTMCFTRYRTRNFFNSFTTNEDIATKFGADLHHCVMVATSSTCYDVVTFLTQWGKSASNFVAISSLVVKLLKKCGVRKRVGHTVYFWSYLAQLFLGW